MLVVNWLPHRDVESVCKRLLLLGYKLHSLWRQDIIHVVHDMFLLLWQPSFVYVWLHKNVCQEFGCYLLNLLNGYVRTKIWINSSGNQYENHTLSYLLSNLIQKGWNLLFI